MDGAVVAAVVIGAVFLLGMVAAAGYAAWMLPPGARVPLNAGVPEYSVWLSKPVGLAAWLGVGVAAFAAVGALTLSGLAANWEQSTRFVLLPGVMMVVLAGEASALIVARRCAAERLGAAPEDAAASGDSVPDDAVPAGESAVAVMASADAGSPGSAAC